MKTKVRFLCTSLALLLAACTVNPITLEREFNIVSESKEIAIGRTAHPQIVEQFGYYYNLNLQNYVTEVGQKLAAASKRRDIEYYFTILDTDMVNAFAVPGGYIYVTRGLLAYLNSEAELAGVLAHEVGHIVGRDSAALMSQSLIAQFATLAGIAGGVASSGSGGGDVAMATSQLSNAIMLGFSREKEYVADEQSVDYTTAAGYDPTQMMAFMRTLSYLGQGPTGPQQYLVTHPYIFDRIDRIGAKCKVSRAMRSTMDQLNRTSPAAPGQGQVLSERYKALLDGLAFGPKDRLQRIKLYTIREGDTLAGVAKKTTGSSVRVNQLAVLNGLPENAQLIPGATLKVIY